MSNRTTAKRLAVAAAGTLLVLTSVLPAFAETPDSAAGTRQKRDGAACDRIARLADGMQGRLDEGRKKLSDRRDERTMRLERHRSELQSKLADRREKFEEHWEGLIKRLESDGATNTVAIAAFKTAMQTAWRNRNAAVDAAHKAFRDGLDKLMSEKKTAVENASLAFKTATSAAFAKAKTDCANSVSSETVITNLRAALKAAQDKFQSDRKAIEKIGEKVKALVQARQAALAKATDDFKAAARKAEHDLKQLLKP